MLNEFKIDFRKELYDGMPDGWYKGFGEQMAAELEQAYEEMDDEEKEWFSVDQVKEKFGELRFYYTGGNKKIDEIERRYCDISCRTCVDCGKPATKYTTGYILPFCDECAAKYPNEKYRDINPLA